MNKNYALKWIVQRVTALILIPASFWFIYSCISFQYLNYYEIKLFFQSYLNSILFFLMMLAMFVHAKLGCETIVQDYVSKNYLKKIFKSFINIIMSSSFILVSIAIIRLNTV